MSPITLTHGPDAYEVILSDDISITHIIRYRHMRNGSGDFVDYEDLPSPLQQLISNSLLDLINNGNPRPKRFSEDNGSGI